MRETVGGAARGEQCGAGGEAGWDGPIAMGIFSHSHWSGRPLLGDVPLSYTSLLLHCACLGPKTGRLVLKYCITNSLI